MSKDNLFIGLICALNMALGLFYLFLFTDPFYAIYHEATQLAMHLAQGAGFISGGGLNIRFAVSAILQPVYPYLLALLIMIFKLPVAFLAMRLLQVAVSALLCFMIYLIAREIFNKKTALIAALLWAVYLPFIHMTTIIWDTTIFTCLVAVVVYLAVKYDNKNLVLAGALGAMLGLTVLTNAVVLIFFPVILSYLWWRFRADGWKTPGNLLAVLVIALAIFFPWSMRNMLVYNGFVPVRSGFWGVIHLTNNPDATGTIWLKHNNQLPRDVNEGITLHYRPLIVDLAPLNEFQQDQYYKARFFNYVRAYPLEFVQRLGAKLFYFWWINPFDRVEPFWLLEYLLILILAAGGLYQAVREQKRVGLFLMMFAALSVVYAIMGPLYNWKYRLPIEPYLIVLAGYGLVKLAELWPGRSRR